MLRPSISAGVSYRRDEIFYQYCRRRLDYRIDLRSAKQAEDDARSVGLLYERDREVPWLRPINVRMEAEDSVIHEEIMLFFLTNSNSVAGFEKLAPEASLSDGLFDLIVLRKCNLADFIRLATMALRGDHLKDPLVQYLQVKELNVGLMITCSLIWTASWAGHACSVQRTAAAFASVCR